MCLSDRKRVSGCDDGLALLINLSGLINIAFANEVMTNVLYSVRKSGIFSITRQQQCL